MTDTIRYILAAVLIIAGLVSAAVSILGVFRFKFVMNRMQCAAILDTLSMGGILCGLMVASASMAYIPKLIAALLMLWVGSPVASHLVGRMEMSIDDTAVQHIEMEDDVHESH